MKKKREDFQRINLTDTDIENNVYNKSKIINIPLIITFILMLAYLILVIANTTNLSSDMPLIIGISILLLFCLFFTITGMFIKGKKSKILIIISSIILSSFSIFNILIETNVIYNDLNNKVIDLTKKNIEEVLNWGEKNNIDIDEIYEKNDTIKKDIVFNQSVKVGTLLKDINKIIVTVSSGPNNKEYTIPNMVGWNLDKVLKYIKEEKISNVIIDFEYDNDIEKDIIFKQSTTSTIKANENFTLTVSLGNKDDISDVKMTNLVGENTFDALIWIKRNSIDYNIEYSLSDTYNEDTIINQSIASNKTFSPLNTSLTIVVASKIKVTIPDFENMTVNEINKWASINKINIYYDESYSETVEEGKVIIDVSTKGNTIRPNQTIKLTVSKGQLKMIKFTILNDFIKWADENSITYNINYEFSSTITAGEVISTSHNEGEIIKNGESINLVISQGGTITVPDFINKSKEEIDQICSNSKIKCVFEYQSNDSVTKNICIKQSMKKDSIVPVNTSVTITISK